MTTLVWFRNDLRLADNPALSEAAKRGAVVPVFIWAPDDEAPWQPGAASRWWLHHSLTALSGDLKKKGSRLIVRCGPTLKTLRALLRETAADAVVWNRRYEPAVIERDTAIKSALVDDGVGADSFNASLLFEPWTVKTMTGKPYQVFTPFWNACTSMPPPAKPLAAPSKIQSPKTWPASDPIDSLELLPKKKWDAAFYDQWTPGENSAARALNTFLNFAHDYPQARNIPSESRTSRLSPHLHFGDIGPRQIWHAMNPRADAVYLKELGWREFAHHLLFHFPHTPEKPLREAFLKFPWEKNEHMLTSWQKGRTGFPIVDAGMRELWTTGWMHNRARMIVASFLVKDLRISWLEGARWFWDTLVDADLANNTLGWQWSAGCGADAAPYFRIFNPSAQAEKFDPANRYIDAWVPEAKNGDTIQPIVDHGEAREKALASFKKILRSAVLMFLSCTGLVVAKDTYRTRPWSSEIMYHIVVDRYSRDGRPVDQREWNEYWGGNLRGIIAHLDDIQKLGVTTLLLTPVTDSYSYHGYDVMDPFSVNPRFGTIQDYKLLIDECHRRDMRLLFDLVTNQFSERSDTFKKHPDWFRKKTGPIGLNAPMFVDHWTAASFFDLPDLNQDNPDVYGHLLRISKYWMDLGIDGFRMDAVTLVRPEFWERFNVDIRKIARPGFHVLGEIFSSDRDQLNAYERAFDSIFDFRFYNGFFPTFTTPIGPEWVVRTMERWEDGKQHPLPIRFIDNHDNERFCSRLGAQRSVEEKAQRLRLAITLLMVSPGVPVLLYGTESHLENIVDCPGYFDKSRSAMNFNVDPETTKLIRRLSALRSQFDFNTPFRRWLTGNGLNYIALAHYRDMRSAKQLLVALNFSNRKHPADINICAFPSIPHPGAFTDYLSGKNFNTDDCRLDIDLPPWGAVLLNVREPDKK